MFTAPIPRTHVLIALMLGGSGCGSPAVELHRDEWGIPHVIAPTPAGAVMGFAYAQAEDNLPQIEESYIRALGRLAEVQGESGVASDRINRLLRIPALARAEYDRLDPEMRSLVDAFAEGLNRYLAESGRNLQTLERIEPWYPLALIRYLYFQSGFALGEVRRAGLVGTTPWERAELENSGSNGFVIGPTRTADGGTLLFINPHLARFGPGQVYEGHLISADGWNFTGYTRFGFPFPYVGHNPKLGWVSTDNSADLADLYLERFDDPADPLRYRYDGDYRVATEWLDTIQVRTDSGLVARVLRLRATHHGPVVGTKNGVPVSLRIARLEEDGWLREWYDMTRATDLASFKRAMEPRVMLFGNAMYADRVGNTFYIYNGAVPRRDPSFDWTQPVDGSISATEWRGYHEFDELPSLENPPSGWMQNSNGTPFLLTDSGNPRAEDYPSYMVQEPDNERSARVRELLRDKDGWTFEELTRTAFDTRMRLPDSLLPTLLPLVDSMGRPARSEGLRLLAEWDRRAEVNSRGLALFDAWVGAQRGGRVPAAPAFDTAVARLTRLYGTPSVEWGKVVRVVRDFSDSVGIPGSGAPSAYGAVFTSWTVPMGETGSIVAGGTSYLSVVEFSRTGVRGVALHALGASADPASPHYMDQAKLMANRTFRPAWLSKADVIANTTVAKRWEWNRQTLHP